MYFLPPFLPLLCLPSPDATLFLAWCYYRPFYRFYRPRILRGIASGVSPQALGVQVLHIRSLSTPVSKHCFFYQIQRQLSSRSLALLLFQVGILVVFCQGSPIEPTLQLLFVPTPNISSSSILPYFLIGYLGGL